MAARILDGKEVSAALSGKIKARAAGLKEKGILPKLAVILAGENEASELYVMKKREAAERLGIQSELFHFKGDVPGEKLLETISSLNQNPSVHGILVQLPLPEKLDKERILNSVAPSKDVDGLNAESLGLLGQGKSTLISATALAVLRILQHYKIPIQGKNAVLVGSSILVGKPLSLLLLNEKATVTLCHKYTEDLASHTRMADLLITATGVEGIIQQGMVKKGAVVLDVGIVRKGTSVVGDVDFEGVKEVASWITPVPGGVGPVTVACLLENVVSAAEGGLG